MTGALESDVSVYYLSTWPVHPYRTATSLLIDGNFPLSLHNVTSQLHLLLKHIQEVSSVSVEGEGTPSFGAAALASLSSHLGGFFFFFLSFFSLEK